MKAVKTIFVLLVLALLGFAGFVFARALRPRPLEIGRQTRLHGLLSPQLAGDRP